MSEGIRFLHSFFEEQVDIQPESIALTGIYKTYTYSQLEQYANQMAHYIRSKGITTGDMVGLYCNRSDLPIVAILGILKAGAGYVPLDPAYPQDRISHILKDASVKLIVTESKLIQNIKETNCSTIISMDDETEIIGKQATSRISHQDINLNENHLCYIIYTSGSTGRPKGVMTEHRNIVKFVKSFKNICALTTQDRIYQGFSFTFDGSVEEIWMAFASGASVVTANNDIAGMPSDAAQYINEKNVTYFSTVPTFLSMIAGDLPTVRLLVVSGEACPQEIVDKWATENRRMLNVYGPTEATVNTTAAECKAGKKVTIGKPLEGYELFILDENMKKVPQGSQGELYISGPTLSRGYMNLPDITNKAFIARPSHLETTFERVYKTGDLVSLNENNELYFYGRLDHQVKIRGYRIELSEIEAVLREDPSVYASAVKAVKNDDKNLTELAAFIVCKKDMTINRRDIITLLKNRLPSYMIPSYLEIIDEMPTLTSGKTDRNRLPHPVNPLIDTDRTIVEQITETEKQIAHIWRELFKISTVSSEDNFFKDLGGYSLVAAQTTTLLRNRFKCDITIRDIYSYPTIKELSAHIDNIVKAGGIQRHSKKNKRKELSSDVFKKNGAINRFTCVLLQAITLITLYSLPALGVFGSVVLYSKAKSGVLSFENMLVISTALFLFLYPSMLLCSIIIKWIVIGKFKEGQYPLWSFYYFRWWLVTRIARLSGASLLAGTPLMSFYLRMMGAKIGKNTTINTPHFSIYDLLTIGDNTSIGFEAQLNGYTVEDGLLKIGTVKIGNNCFIGIQSNIGLNSSMQDNACLDDLSLLSENDNIPTGEQRHGSPSRKTNFKLPSIDSSKQRKPLNTFLFNLFSIFSVYFVEAFLLLTTLPSGIIAYYAFLKDSWMWWISLLLLSTLLFEITFWCLLILLKYIILFKAKPGVYNVKSVYYLRKWIVDSLLSMSRLLTLPVYTTLYSIPLLRLLGVKIGKRAELSVLGYISPDLVTLGSESFFADGSIVGGTRLYNGYFELSANVVGSRSFIGNSALVKPGTTIGDNCLIGVLSVPPANMTSTKSDSEWLGSPSFELPHRKKVEGFKEQQIYKPSSIMYILRLCVDLLRILIPSILEIATVVALIVLTAYTYKYCTTLQCFLILPIIGNFIAFSLVLSTIIIKNLIMGIYKPVIKPLWSPYVWFNEVINGVYESIVVPALTPLMGTPFITFFLRLLGIKSGKHTFIETLLFGEFDLVEIGDYTALNFDVIIQNHLFEDRIFKSSRLKIGNNCSVGNMSVILYDTIMEDGSSIGPLSLMMKGESVPTNSCWEGVPIS